MKSKEKAVFIAELVSSKKAEDIVILDMADISNITNFFIIATASSGRRAQTIADTIEEGLKKKKESLSSIEGYKEPDWIVVDAYDVVVHIFNQVTRDFYNLESLWGDAKRIKLCQKKKKKSSKKTSRKK